MCKLFLQPCQTSAIIRITGRQRPDCVKMVWQQYNRMNRHRPLPFHLAKDRPQQLNIGFHAKNREISFRLDCEEERPTCNMETTVVRHETIINRTEWSAQRTLQVCALQIRQQTITRLLAVVALARRLIRSLLDWCLPRLLLEQLPPGRLPQRFPAVATR